MFVYLKYWETGKEQVGKLMGRIFFTLDTFEKQLKEHVTAIKGAFRKYNNN